MCDSVSWLSGLSKYPAHEVTRMQHKCITVDTPEKYQIALHGTLCVFTTGRTLGHYGVKSFPKGTTQVKKIQHLLVRSNFLPIPFKQSCTKGEKR